MHLMGFRQWFLSRGLKPFRELEAADWMIVEPSAKQANGGPILMKRQSDGDLSHILVMPNGERSSPAAAQIRDW